MTKWQSAMSISQGFTIGSLHSVRVLFEFGAIPQLISMTHMATVSCDFYSPCFFWVITPKAALYRINFSQSAFSPIHLLHSSKRDRIWSFRRFRKLGLFSVLANSNSSLGAEPVGPVTSDLGGGFAILARGKQQPEAENSLAQNIKHAVCDDFGIDRGLLRAGRNAPHTN